MDLIAFRSLAVLAGAAALLGGCDGGHDPSEVNLRVTVLTSGVDYPNAYLLRADGEPGQAVTTQVTVYRFLSLGAHEIRLERLPANCTLNGPESVPVTIERGQLVSVVFQVECRAVTGVISVTALFSGRDFDNDGFNVVATATAGAGSVATFLGGSGIIPGVPAGSYDITLTGLNQNCRIIGPTVQASVTVGGLVYDTARVQIPVECTATTGDVRLVAVTSGSDLDTDGYSIWLDGVELRPPTYSFYYYYYYPPVRLSPNGEHLLGQISPGSHIIELREIALNCAVEGSNPRTVTVNLGLVTEASFQIVCAAP
jgi:hypothetical protein